MLFGGRREKTPAQQLRLDDAFIIPSQLHYSITPHFLNQRNLLNHRKIFLSPSFSQPLLHLKISALNGQGSRARAPDEIWIQLHLPLKLDRSFSPTPRT